MSSMRHSFRKMLKTSQLFLSIFSTGRSTYASEGDEQKITKTSEMLLGEQIKTLHSLYQRNVKLFWSKKRHEAVMDDIMCFQANYLERRAPTEAT